MRRNAIRTAQRILCEGRTGVADPSLGDDADALRDAAREWRFGPGVVGTGIGRRYVCGDPISELALRVYVREKRPRSRLRRPVPELVEIPGVEQLVPVDVVACGELRPQSGRTRPASGGSRIGHFRDTSSFGTLTCLVRSRHFPSTLYLLSNRHVLAPVGVTTAERDPIIQPPQHDGGGDGDAIAHLSKWLEFVSGGPGAFPNLCDAAIAKIKPGMVESSIQGLGRLAGTSYFVIEGMEVRVFGAGTGVPKSAIITDTDFELSVPFGSESFGFRRQVVYVDKDDPNTSPTTAGDSGAAIVNRRDQIVGLNFFASASKSVFNRIRFALDAFQVDVVIDPPPHDSTPASPSGVTPPVDAPDVDDPEDALEVFARTLWGEARGEGERGIEAVAEVIVNRVNHRPRGLYGGSVEKVCKKPWQFSCWNPGDPNRNQLMAVGPGDPQYEICLEVAQRALRGEITAQTNGAKHYMTKARRAQGWPRSWGRERQHCAEVGNHLFYNNVDD